MIDRVFAGWFTAANGGSKIEGDTYTPTTDGYKRRGFYSS